MGGGARDREQASASPTATATLRVAVFGSEGSFSEEAGVRHAEALGGPFTILHEPEMDGVLRAVDEGRADRGVLPVHNSIGGLVRATFEALGRRRFAPLDQITLDVRHHLIVRSAAVAAHRIERVVSHPQALIQCERFLARRLPRAERVAWNDTASAARDLAGGTLGDATAVLASRRAAERFGLAVLEADVQDSSTNRTTFVVVGRAGG